MKAEKAKELAEKIMIGFRSCVWDEDKPMLDFIESLLSEALEENTIVTSQEGTSYCRFCNQQAKKVEEARADEREQCAMVAQAHHSNEAGHQDQGFDECLIAELIR